MSLKHVIYEQYKNFGWEEVENLRREYQVLSREVARLGSLHRIAQLAQSQGFEPSQERIIIVRPSQLVKR